MEVLIVKEDSDLNKNEAHHPEKEQFSEQKSHQHYNPWHKNLLEALESLELKSHSLDAIVKQSDKSEWHKPYYQKQPRNVNH